MIVPMKKIHLVVQNKDVPEAMDRLRDLAVVHVEHQKELEGEKLNDLREEVYQCELALSAIKPKKGKVEQAECKDVTQETRVILDRLEEVEKHKEKITHLQALTSKWESWGDFNPKDFDYLKEKGLHVKLCEVPTKNTPDAPEGVVLEPIKEDKKLRRCMAISRTDTELPYDTIDPPEVSLKQMWDELTKEKAALLEVEEKIKEEAKYSDSLKQQATVKEENLQFEEVVHGLKAEGELAVLKGYCPEDQSETLEEAAKKEGWAVLIEDLEDDDIAPTKLKNSKIIELSKPALQLIEILPGYKELDVSAVFLVFFTLFFAMLIGDAAYGAIFLLLTAVAHMKLKNKVEDHTAFYLGYMLTGFTMIWGVLTGTYFGQEWLPSTVNAVVPWLNDSANIQWLCFTIALVHLSLARVWTALVKFPSLTFLSEIGWMFIIWGMYFLANMFVLNRPLPPVAGWFFIIGISLAFLFMVPFKYFLKKVPQEIIPFVLSVIGAGTDIISYIRLFAVGLATVAVADAANGMPAALPGGPGIVFMVFLHVLNLILAAMAILVHAIRLNVLEFSGHLGLEWVGIKYNPFQKKLKKV